MRIIKLTAIFSTYFSIESLYDIYVAVDRIIFFHRVISQEETILKFDGVTIFVKETPKEIIKKIEDAKKDF